MHKRKLKRNDSIPSKKSKCCCFPFHIGDIVKLIASYLEGDHLLHFKLTCKTLYEITKNMSCMIKITLENIERTTSTPGFHIIETNGDGALMDYIRSSQKRYPLITNLIIDYCGIELKVKNTRNIYTRAFDNLYSLRIIRCRDIFSIMILKSMKKLSILEIYTNRNITVFFARQVEHVRLCSSRKRSRIRIRILPSFNQKSINFLKYCHSACISANGQRIAIPNGPYREFVPNPNFM